MSVVTKEYPYRVRIEWDNYLNWNEICAQVVEHHGLPGGKYITDTTSNYMDFNFKDECDAIWFSLRVV